MLASKYACSMRRDDPNAGGSHRKSFVQALDGSLERLGCDYIDIYWVHIWDPLTPVEEVLRCLDDAVRAGKVLYTGISDTPAWIVSHAVAIADERRWTRFAGLQVPYSLVERTVERELLPMARQLDLGITDLVAARGRAAQRPLRQRPPAAGRLACRQRRGLPSERAQSRHRRCPQRGSRDARRHRGPDGDRVDQIAPGEGRDHSR